MGTLFVGPVVDQDTALPIAGATVTRQGPGEPAGVADVTDATGYVAVTDPGDAGFVIVDVAATGYFPQSNVFWGDPYGVGPIPDSSDWLVFIEQQLIVVVVIEQQFQQLFIIIRRGYAADRADTADCYRGERLAHPARVAG